MVEEDDKEKNIHVRCSPEFKRRIRTAAAAEDKSMSEWVREVLADAADARKPLPDGGQ